jgi:nicotinic acid phosphoribosyltransferase
MDPYQKKYLKYKSKYLLMQSELEQEGGAFTFTERTDIYPVVEPVLREKDSDESKDDYQYVIKAHPLKVDASIEGKRLLDDWLRNRKSNGIDEVLKKFNPQGKPLNIKASAFSDYYKWTMMPVIWHLHKIFMSKNSNKNTLKVTFGIDIRDKTMRDAINTDPVLRDEIKRSLDELKGRLFDISIFKEMNEAPNLLNGTLSTECINYICDSRTLAASVTMADTGKITYKDDDEVHIGFYKVASAKYNPSDAAGLWFIEARGPWPRVTWLETSLMQAVYEAYLRYNLKKLATEQKITLDKAYERWLYGALLRCAKSVAFTRTVQKMDGKQITPALFTGRRTGGYLFLMLQNLFFAHHFNQAGVPNPEPSKTMCLGTSSVDCHFELLKLKLPCLRPVGTHAHELSMVISVLFPYFDKNKYELPLTQIIGHELYRVKSAMLRPGPTGIIFPMLPDTLGTAAFMKAANWVKMPDGKPFISLINSARQDSGKLPDFLTLMTKGNYTLAKMASEIDNTEILLRATELGYNTFGAGGFFGDSVKVWNPNKQYYPPSMAVKAVKVEYNVPAYEKQLYTELGTDFPHINRENLDSKGYIIGYPIKIGDPDSLASTDVGKLSLDKTLPEEKIEKIREWASIRRTNAISIENYEELRKNTLSIETFIVLELYPNLITTKLARIRG